MKPYRFRLAAVQQLRESRRDDMRMRLADALLAAEKLEQESQRLREELTETLSYRKAESSKPHPNGNRLVELQRYEVLLTGQLNALAEKQRLVAEETDRRRQALALADREVRVLELLDERSRERHRQQEVQEEQKQLDEIATVAWRRQNSLY